MKNKYKLYLKILNIVAAVFIAILLFGTYLMYRYEISIKWEIAVFVADFIFIIVYLLLYEFFDYKRKQEQDL